MYALIFFLDKPNTINTLPLSDAKEFFFFFLKGLTEKKLACLFVYIDKDFICFRNAKQLKKKQRFKVRKFFYNTYKVCIAIKIHLVYVSICNIVYLRCNVTYLNMLCCEQYT